MNKTQLSKILTRYYSFNITSIDDAPRQFVAETFIVKTDKITYFCKLIEKQLFTQGVIDSLPVLANIHDLGNTNINYPIPTKSGDLFIRVDSALVVLFNFIDAPQNYDYDREILGRTMAEIHQLSSKITVHVNQEKYSFKHERIFLNKLNQISNEYCSEDIALDLQQLMKKNYSTIVEAYVLFQRIAKICSKAGLQLVITHGDAPGNVLVKSPDDIYIVDWDDILLAPAERDLWFMTDNQDFMNGYTEEVQGYAPKQTVLEYYLLNRYFNDMVEYWAEILGDFTDEHRNSNFRQLKKELFSKDGWLYPMVEDFLSRNK